MAEGKLHTEVAAGNLAQDMAEEGIAEGTAAEDIVAVDTAVPGIHEGPLHHVAEDNWVVAPRKQAAGAAGSVLRFPLQLRLEFV